MRQTFEVTSFPDLSLPRYYDLLGDEALTVVATRLFTWLQLASSTRQPFSFVLRYRFDPSRSPSNRRLRVFVLLGGVPDASADPLSMGLRLTREVLDVQAVAPSEAAPMPVELVNIALLERSARLLHDSALYLPSPWTRQSSARNALEPYLDEAFAALSAPAFLDIQIHSADPAAARQSVRAALTLLERRKRGEQTGGEDYLPEFQALSASLADDPVARLLVCAGSTSQDAAEGLLRAFGIDAIGGARFKVVSSRDGDDLNTALRSAVVDGSYEFSDGDGWYNGALRRVAKEKEGTLTSAQLRMLRNMSELSVLAGADLLRDVLTLPVPRRGFLRTFPLETEGDRHPQIVDIPSKRGFVRLGTGLERETAIDLPLSDLTRHAFVAGVTGSGKTVTMFNLLKQLAEQNVPFLVFEPAKAEYRGLLGFSAVQDKLRIYSPGRDDLAPLRLNPFAFEPHVTLAQHLANLSAGFSCALGLFQPVSAILEEALWRLYEARGWREDDRGDKLLTLPRVEEIVEVACDVVDSMGYDPEINGRFKGVLRSRFIRLARGAVGRLFDSRSSCPSITELCSVQSVVELKALSQQESNLVTMFLLIAVREHMSGGVSPHGQPRLVMVLEEAHNLVPAVADEQSGSEESSAKVEASRYVSNMLAEMRAMGLAILVVDQTPAAVAPQVIRNTNLKIAHRTVAKQDRETLADAMLMQPTHAELLGRLVPGQAYVYADRFFRPHLMQGAFAQGDKPLGGSPSPPSDEVLRGWLVGRKSFKEELKNRVKESLERVDEIHDELNALGTSMQEQMAELERLLDVYVWEERKQQLLASWRLRQNHAHRRIQSLEAELRAIDATPSRTRGGSSQVDLKLIRKLDAKIDASIAAVAAVRVGGAEA